MITVDQYERLLVGDTITYQFTGTIRDFGCDFDLYLKDADGHETYHTSNELRHMTVGEVSAEQPKYDPSRLFKKGDKVKPAERHGRKNPKLNYKAEYTVTSSEDDYGTVGIEYFNGAMSVSVNIPFYWLELITPVKELEPFYLDEITDEDEDEEQYHCFMIKTLKGEDRIRTYYANKFETIAQTKAAAEAERDRLNAEWRKEQK